MRHLLSAMGVAALFLSAPVIGQGQDFQRSYNLSPGGEVSIHSTSGNVSIKSYGGSSVQVTAYREGRDRELVEIEDRSSSNRVDLRSWYPQNCNCNASVRFEVEVPAHLTLMFNPISSSSGNVSVMGAAGELRARSSSGNVNVEDFSGPVEARSSSGDVTIKGARGKVLASSSSGNVRVSDVHGSATARSSSGNVEVRISHLEGADDMAFSSSSGNVTVKVPAYLGANVSLSTSSGRLKSDFPLEFEQTRSRNPRWARGQVGGDSRSLTMRSSSGNVSLLQLVP